MRFKKDESRKDNSSVVQQAAKPPTIENIGFVASRGRVLVMDDDLVIKDIISCILDNLGYNAFLYSNPEGLPYKN